MIQTPNGNTYFFEPTRVSLRILVYAQCFFNKNEHQQSRNIQIINISKENKGKIARIDLQHNEFLIFYRFLKVFWTMLKTCFESSSNVMNCRCSQNALKTNEKLWKPSKIDPPNDELINIPEVLHCFWSLLGAWFQYLPKLPKCRIPMDHKML